MSKHDKKSTTGFLDSLTLFSRSTSKRSNKHYYNGANGARPISAEGDSLTDAQDVEFEILKLTNEEVNQKFLEILDDMNIPKDKREPLISKTMKEKRDMLKMHLKGEFFFRET
jgi:diaphanous 2